MQAFFQIQCIPYLYIISETDAAIATLVNLDGKMQKTRPIDKGRNEMDVSGLMEGIYYLYIQSDDAILQKKILIF